MLYCVKELYTYAVETRDEPIGPPYEFCFDDQNWQVRYLVVDLGDWLLEHKVLVPPALIGQPDQAGRRLPLALTRQQVLDSPLLDTHKPVYLQHQATDLRYLIWAPDMQLPGAMLMSPAALRLLEQTRAEGNADDSDPHLRSTREVCGYHIVATDGEVGHVEDFIIDGQTWLISYLVIDTRNWLPGHKVIIAPQWIEKVRWGERKVHMQLKRQTIEQSPEFDPNSLRHATVA